VSYQVFARKYRPTTFADVLGQDHVVRTLRNAIEQDRIAQAYLFAGPRGTGKTSTARILSKALNCTGGPKIDFDPSDPVCIEIAEGRSLDVLEIDGASNNSVDQIRELRETVRFAPTSGQYKIYYIDEVHMLSTAAFNALLKTLEEPPAHVKFIFATTEPNKVLPTILSRCQRFDLRPISAPVIAKHLLHIATEEGITLEADAAQAIAKGADGGMRDAQSMLDQLVAFCGETITEANVLDIFGFASQETIARLTDALLERRTADALELIHNEHQAGRDLSNLLGELIQFFRNLLLITVSPKNALPDLMDETRTRLDQLVGKMSTDRLLEATDLLAEYQNKMRWSADKQLHFELAAIRTIQLFEETSVSDVIRILRNVADGAVPASPTMAPPTAPGKPEPSIATTPKVETNGEPQTEPNNPEPEAEVLEPEPISAEPAPESPATDSDPAEETEPDGAGPLDGFSLDDTPPPSTSAPKPPPEDVVPPVEPAPILESADQVMAELIRRLELSQEGMVIAALEGAKVMEFGEPGLTVAFPSEAEFEVETVVKPNPALPRIAAELGFGASLVLELSDDLELSEVDLSIPDYEDFAPKAEPTDTTSAPAEEKAPEQEEEAPLIAQQPGFFDDPLITALVEEFALREVKKSGE